MPSRWKKIFNLFEWRQIKIKRKVHESERFPAVQKHFDDSLTAVGTGTFTRFPIANPSGIKTADSGQCFLSKLRLKSAPSVFDPQRTGSVIRRADFRIGFIHRMLNDVQRSVQPLPQFRTAADANKTKIILHGNGNRPAVTACMPARSHFTMKIRIIIRNKIQLCVPHIEILQCKNY